MTIQCKQPLTEQVKTTEKREEKKTWEKIG